MGAKPITIIPQQLKTDLNKLKKAQNCNSQKNDRILYQPQKAIQLEKPLKILPEEELPLLLIIASFEQFLLDENKLQNRKLIRQQFLLDMRKIKHRCYQKSQQHQEQENEKQSNFTSLKQIKGRKIPVKSILKCSSGSIQQLSHFNAIKKHVSFEYRRINTERKLY